MSLFDTLLNNPFFGTSGNSQADIFIIGEIWSRFETRVSKPFQGAIGNEFTKILSEAGISKTNCFMSTILPAAGDIQNYLYTNKEAKELKLSSTKGMYPKPLLQQAIKNVKIQIEKVNPKIIIGLGNLSLWLFTDDCFIVKTSSGYKLPSGITNWRGSQLQTSEEFNERKFLPVYNPTTVIYKWPWRYDLVHDLKARVPLALNDTWKVPAYNFIIQPSFDKVMEVLNLLIEKAKTTKFKLSEDIETFNGFITCVGIAWNSLDAICIPFTLYEGGHYFTLYEETEIILKFRELHTSPNIEIIGQNFLYDAQYYTLYFSFIPNCTEDTMLLHHLCWPGKEKSLAYICSLYNPYYRFWKEDGKVRNPKFSDTNHWIYNATDAVNTFTAMKGLRKVIAKLNLIEQAKERAEVFKTVLRMMIRGVNIDRKLKAKLSNELGKTLKEKQTWLDSMIIFPITDSKKVSPWYTSPSQQATLFYDLLGIKEVKGRGKRSAKGRTCNDDALTTIGKREPLVAKITEVLKEVRSLQIFKTNFLDCSLDPDNRLRSAFDPSGTRTFRWNSRENAFGNGTNLQNIPSGHEL